MPGQVSPATGLLSRLLDVVRQAEHPLGHDVALHLAGAPADGQGGGEQEAVVPHRRIGAERTLAREPPTGSGEVLVQPRHPLRVLVGPALTERGLSLAGLALAATGSGPPTVY